jgi:hypothetical protein
MSRVLTALVIAGTFALASACDLPDEDEKDPGTVVGVHTVGKKSDQVTVRIKRDSNDSRYTAGPFGGTACVRGDHWPECH